MNDDPRDTLVARLICALSPVAGDEAPDVVPDVPDSAPGLPPARLAAVVAMLAAAPAIVAATPPGVSKGRITALLLPDERRHGGALMVLLDRAGVLVEPRSEALRWREPRPFRSADTGWIIQQVQAAARENR